MTNAIFDPVFVKRKHTSPEGRFGGARGEPARIRSSHLCLSAVVPAFAEPDIHSLSQIPRNHHRRLSVCSLPVLKQFGVPGLAFKPNSTMFAFRWPIGKEFMQSWRGRLCSMDATCSKGRC